MSDSNNPNPDYPDYTVGESIGAHTYAMGQHLQVFDEAFSEAIDEEFL